MKTLKTLSRLKGDVLYLALGLLLVAFVFKALYMVLVLGVYLFAVYRIEKKWVVLIIILGFIYSVRLGLESRPVTLPSSGVVMKHHPTASRELIHTPSGRFWLRTDTPLKIGDEIDFTATREVFKTPDLLGAFDYQGYLKARGIQGVLTADELTVVGNKITWHMIPARVSDYIDEHTTFMRPYLRAFVLADRSAFDEDLMTSVNALGVSHIFAISGLHITLMAFGLDAGLKKALAPKPRLLTILSFLTVYGGLTGFTPSFIRASFLYGFTKSQSGKEEGFTPMDGLSIIFIVMMVLRPYSLSDMGFVLSYLVTFGLVGLSHQMRGPYGLLKVSGLAFSLTLPVILLMHGSVNLSSIVLNTFYVLALTFLILPVSYFVFLFPISEPLFEGVIKLFEGGTLFIYDVFYWPLTIPYLVGMMAVIYYGLLLWLLTSAKKMKPTLFLVGFLLGLFLIRPLNPYQQLTMLDVDGNAFLFEDRFNRCVGLIDGGDVSTQEALLKHLKLRGYQRFDMVIVTHDHRDHTAGIEALLKDPYFKIDRLITEINAPDGLTLEVCGGLHLVFYPPLDAIRKNDRSLVTGLIFDAFSVLSTGDIERLGEGHLITFPQRDYLFLTLPHHGSNTSSSDGLLDFVKPQYALASLPHRNVHGFPHADVRERLAQRNILLKTTDDGGTWVIRGTKNRYFINP